MKAWIWVLATGALAGCSEAGADPKTSYARAIDCQILTGLIVHYDPEATQEMRTETAYTMAAFGGEAAKLGAALGLTEEMINADKLSSFEGVQDRVRQVGTVAGSKEIQSSAQKCLRERP